VTTPCTSAALITDMLPDSVHVTISFNIIKLLFIRATCRVAQDETWVGQQRCVAQHWTRAPMERVLLLLLATSIATPQKLRRSTR
jgi:hypothetical protein